jgi:hypothetical protein
VGTVRFALPSIGTSKENHAAAGGKQEGVKFAMKTTTKILALAFVALVAVLVMGAPVTAADDAGQKAYMDQGCDKCHGIAEAGIEAKIKSEKMQGPDLGELSAEKDAAWVKQYLKKEVQIDGKDHKAKWDGSDAELDAIANWLVSMK